MATTFSAMDNTQIFRILGIPLGGGGVIVTSLSHIPPTLAALWTTTWTQAFFTEMVTMLLGYLSAATPEVVQLVEASLATYGSIAVSPMKVTKSGDSEGVLIDHAAQRELIRQDIAKMIGIWCPRGGFIAESDRLYGNGTAGMNGGAGDR